MQNPKFSKAKFIYRAFKYRFRNDKSELKYVINSIKQGQLVLDIGSHKGGYLHWICKAVGSTGQVIAFEPQPILHTYLASSISAFGHTNIDLHHAGVSVQQGSMDLYIPKADGLTSPGATFEKRKNTDKGHFIKVPVYQLDKLLEDRKQKVSFIKMDVEGHELEVFKGAEDILTKDAPKILVECENRHLNGITVFDVFEYLKGLGFEGHFFYQGIRLPLDKFDPEVHQAVVGNQIVDKKNYANNFTFEK